MLPHCIGGLHREPFGLPFLMRAGMAAKGRGGEPPVGVATCIRPGGRAFAAPRNRLFGSGSPALTQRTGHEDFGGLAAHHAEQRELALDLAAQLEEQLAPVVAFRIDSIH